MFWLKMNDSKEDEEEDLMKMISNVMKMMNDENHHVFFHCSHQVRQMNEIVSFLNVLELTLGKVESNFCFSICHFLVQ